MVMIINFSKHLPGINELYITGFKCTKYFFIIDTSGLYREDILRE